MVLLGTGLSNSLIINKFTRIIHLKIGLNSQFWGQKTEFKDRYFNLDLIIPLAVYFDRQNSASKALFISKKWLNLFILKQLLWPVPNSAPIPLAYRDNPMLILLKQ
jgi:hypothetical protein